MKFVLNVKKYCWGKFLLNEYREGRVGHYFWDNYDRDAMAYYLSKESKND